jgi:CRISPR/Cas system-associated endonuclease/helicase Cas3
MNKLNSLLEEEEEESIFVRGIRSYKSNLLLPTICKTTLILIFVKRN